MWESMHSSPKVLTHRSPELGHHCGCRCACPATKPSQSTTRYTHHYSFTLMISNRFDDETGIIQNGRCHLTLSKGQNTAAYLLFHISTIKRKSSTNFSFHCFHLVCVLHDFQVAPGQCLARSHASPGRPQQLARHQYQIITSVISYSIGKEWCIAEYFDGLVQACSTTVSNTLAIETLQSCTKPSTCIQRCKLFGTITFWGVKLRAWCWVVSW